MANQSLPPKATRRFSKRILVANLALAWGAIYFAIFHQQAEWVAASGFGLVLTLYGLYVGTGHLDMRAAVQAIAGKPQADSYAPPLGGPVQELPPDA
jgi:hypothetical protein